MSRQSRAVNARAKAVAEARRRTGMTQAKLDEQYRRALAKNPLATRSGGRTAQPQQ